MISHPAKRYACDRCREQKLRCPRDQQSDDSCERCLRLGASCIISSGRPLGRPPVQINCQSRDQAHGSRSLDHDQRGRLSRGRGFDISASAVMNPLLSPRSQGAVSDNSESSTLPALNPVRFDAIYDLMADCESSGPPPNLARGFGLMATEAQFSEAFGNVSNLDLRDLGDLTDAPTESIQTSVSETDSNFKRSDSSISSPFLGGRPMELHAVIIGNISHQLGELKGKPWESWDRYLARAPQNDRPDLESTISSRNEQNPWDGVLSVVMKLVLVLQTMLPPQTADPTTPTYFPPTLSMTLMLLSTYIQLGELLNIVMGHISHHLQQGQPPFTSSSSSLASGTGTGGRQLPGHSASLQVSMMIRFIESQSQLVESLMGFPADCRVWNRRDLPAGILDHDETFFCTQAVMKQAQEPFQALKRAIESMKATLR